MSGNFIYRHHVEPRVKLYWPKEESFPTPLKKIDVSRTTQTNLDVKSKKPHRRLLEHRWNKRVVCSLDRFHSIHVIGRETSKRIYVVRGDRLTRKQLTSRPELWIKLGRNANLKERHKWFDEKPKLDNARRLRGIYFIDPEGWLLLCLARQARTVSIPNHHEDRSAGKGDNSLQHFNLVHKIILCFKP